MVFHFLIPLVMSRLIRLHAIALLVFAAPLLFADSPKLVVVISLDQFRYDYLERFRQHFGEKGFKYLLANGANFANASFKYAKTSTGPGHATLLTGSYANGHGIIANDWFNRNLDKQVYCYEDLSAQIVGKGGEGRSPRHLVASTIGDELRLNTSFRSKVISLSNKDRAAIPMGGMMPTGAFWMSESLFVTSTYYMTTLPGWVQRFNASGLINSFFGKSWTRLLPEAAYAGLDDDGAEYETGNNGLGKAFPHPVTGKDRSRITSSYYWALLASPFSADILNAFAKEAIRSEELGKRDVTDLLCVGFSVTDEIGHAFGPNSHEIMDMVVRMDRVLADLFSFLETQVGLNNCLIVLSADHGVAPIPDFILKNHPAANAGWVSWNAISGACEQVLVKRYGPAPQGRKWIRRIVASNVYIDRSLLGTVRGASLEEASRLVVDTLRSIAEVATAMTASELSGPFTQNPLENRLKRSFYISRSGDVVYALKPYWVSGKTGDGAKHGEPYDYDAHVPLVIAGQGVRPGKYFTEASPVDIGPTLSALLGISFPAGRDGRVLHEALK